MITEITKAQLLTFRLGQLRNEGKATSAQISMAKRNNVEIALNIAKEARQIHGGMGITSEYSMMRHMANLESVNYLRRNARHSLVNYRYGYHWNSCFHERNARFKISKL
jgi:alkylation response protein AidB-like acyl-CoA dehydrogenase